MGQVTQRSKIAFLAVSMLVGWSVVQADLTSEQVIVTSDDPAPDVLAFSDDAPAPISENDDEKDELVLEEVLDEEESEIDVDTEVETTVTTIPVTPDQEGLLEGQVFSTIPTTTIPQSAEDTSNTSVEEKSQSSQNGTYVKSVGPDTTSTDTSSVGDDDSGNELSNTDSNDESASDPNIDTDPEDGQSTNDGNDDSNMSHDGMNGQSGNGDADGDDHSSHDDANNNGDGDDPHSGHDGDAGPVVTGPAPVNYAQNLAMIRAQTGRNTNLDSSPYKNTPQAQLPIGDGSPLLGPRAAYVQPNNNQERAWPIAAGGQFRVACEFSHFAYDDPILYPSQPGAAHLHMFFGNTDVNAYSTVDTLNETGSSTCNGAELNRTGYWSPAMIDGDGNARIPERVVVYYKGEGLANGANHDISTGSQVYKRGMANISPAPYSVPEVANSLGGQAGQVNYKCSNNYSGYPYVTGVNQLPNCSGDYWNNLYGAPYPAIRTVLEMEVKFWNCFDTTKPLTEWQSWVPAGGQRGGWFFSNCKGNGGGQSAAHQDIYPNLSYFINYVVEPGEDTSDWYLSSDVDPTSIHSGGSLIGAPGATHHADWWGGWHPTINEEWIDNCVNYANPSGAASGCGVGYLSDGGPNGASPVPGRALRLRDDYDIVGDSNTYKRPVETLFNQLCAPLNPGRSFTTATAAAYCVPNGVHNHG